MIYRSLITLLAVLVLVPAFFMAGVADHRPDERSAAFVGTTWLEHELNETCAGSLGEDECIIRIPSGVLSAVCDGEDHTWMSGPYDGYGGVEFCGVPKEAIIELAVEEATGAFEVQGLVTCRASTQPVVWNKEFGRLSSTEPSHLRVPSWCEDTGDEDHPVTATVNVFLAVGSLVEPGVHAAVEGEVSLRVL